MVENKVGYVVMTYMVFRTLLSGHFVPSSCFCISLGHCSFTNRFAHVTKAHKSGVRETYSTVSVTFHILTSIVIRRKKKYAICSSNIDPVVSLYALNSEVDVVT